MIKLSKKLFGAYSYALSSPEGCEVLQDLREVSGRDSFMDSTDPIQLAYNAGKRDMCLYIETMMKEGKQ